MARKPTPAAKSLPATKSDAPATDALQGGAEKSSEATAGDDDETRVITLPPDGQVATDGQAAGDTSTYTPAQSSAAATELSDEVQFEPIERAFGPSPAEFIARIASLDQDERDFLARIGVKLGVPVDLLEEIGLELDGPMIVDQLGEVEAIRELPEDFAGHVIYVASRRQGGFRRIGRQFGPKAVPVEVDALSADELGRLMADPELIVSLSE